MLLGARKPGEIRIAREIGAVLVITAVRDGETDFVQTRRQGQCIDVLWNEFPVFRHLLETGVCRALDSLGLGLVHVKTGGESAQGSFTRIFVTQPSQQVIEQTLTQSGAGDVHAFDVERLESGAQNRDAAGQDRRSVGAEPRQIESGDMTGIDKRFA